MGGAALRRNLIIVGIVFLGLFLRVYETAPSSLWTDEFATYWISSAGTLSECVARAVPTQGQSPFYYILEWSILKLLPDNEFSLRLLSLGASVISIYLIYYLGLLLFSCRRGMQESCVIAEDKKHEEENSSFSSSFYPAMFAGLLFSLNGSMIYYAQEARPYALAIMFALLSQIFFIRLIDRFSRVNSVFYILFSSLLFYTHYVFGSLILIQTVWLFLLMPKRKESAEFAEEVQFGNRVLSLKTWCIIQVFLFITLVPLFFHLVPIISSGGKWNWLQGGTFSDAFAIFANLADMKFMLFSGSLFLFLLTMKNLFFIKDNGSTQCHCYRLINRDAVLLFFLLLIWFSVPFLSAYFATLLLHSSFLDQRYMLLALPALFLIGGWCASVIPDRVVKYIFIAVVMFFLFIHSLVPAFLSDGRFSRRIPHNWRGALEYMDKHFRDGDAVILRSGMIKENWITDSDVDPIVREYVRAPLNSFYFHHTVPDDNIYNLTFSPSRKFEPYYRKVSDSAERSSRIWIVGVGAPNGFPIDNIKSMFNRKRRVIFEHDYSGVSLTLLDSPSGSVK